MLCKCGGKLRVKDVRQKGNEMHRLRVCDTCGKCLITYEINQECYDDYNKMAVMCYGLSEKLKEEGVL